MAWSRGVARERLQHCKHMQQRDTGSSQRDISLNNILMMGIPDQRLVDLGNNQLVDLSNNRLVGVCAGAHLFLQGFVLCAQMGNGLAVLLELLRAVLGDEAHLL